MTQIDESSIASSSFSDFAQVLQVSKDSDLAARLDPERGTALIFADICGQRARSALDDAGYNQRAEGLDDDSRQSWLLEQHTWTLIHLLSAERLQRGQPSKPLDLSQDRYETPFSAVQAILDQDPEISELKIIREWLQDTLPAKHIVEVRKGYWTFTKNRVRAEKRAGGPGGAGRMSLGSGLSGKNRGKAVKNLDPDAISRGEGSLELEDAAYEKALLRTLFEYTRAGKLDLAFDLCRQTDQSWRAASLRGAMLYHDPSISSGIEEIQEPIGNRNRALWKSVCRKLAQNPSLDEYERALYGSLSGDLPSVTSVSQTWEEYLWAHINSKLETLIDAKLDEARSWWSQKPDIGLFTDVECGAVKLSDNNTIDKETGSLDSIFDKLAQTQAHGIHTQAADPFHVVQRSVISNNVNELLNRVAGRLPEMRHQLEPPQFARILRFFSHLILYLRLLEQPLPDLVCNDILSAYVHVLEQAGEASLVAMYASSLEPQSATVSYAHFLKSMDVNTSVEAKRESLLQAEENDLDLTAVARTVVDMVFDDLFTSIPTDLPLSLTQFDTRLQPNEEILIKSVDWLTFCEPTYADAIVQSNALMRLFLATGRLHAARALLLRLPYELVSVVPTLQIAEDQAIEHAHWRTFFDAFALHVRYKEFISSKPFESASKVDRHNWVKALSNIVEQSRAADLQLLQMDWVKLDVDDETIDGERRMEELDRIRHIYIPETVFRLHDMLVETSDVAPHHLGQALRLAELVSEENHKLYLDFITSDGNLLKDYLSRVREATLGLLELGDPFKVAVSADEA
ncbi:nuclear pore protein 84/107 [Violaceomyces palustris]|uniref:Nuclear pore protein 84/107 n=1 Tax=Violaceomyces palustris TaxID=1673888 RepID=A0ACD0P4U0_9BASI|nr:nuclear pore protein 84/107 [Violaceomyces palustris]